VLWKRLRDNRKRKIIVQFDGAIGLGGHGTGLGVVLRDADGHIQHVLKRRVGPQTNNEAEYAALIWALEILSSDPPDEAHFVSDSEIVVRQMQGQFSVRSPALKKSHRRACALLRNIPITSFTHIPRDHNLLADALAKEALAGWPINSSPCKGEAGRG